LCIDCKNTDAPSIIENNKIPAALTPSDNNNKNCCIINNNKSWWEKRGVNRKMETEIHQVSYSSPDPECQCVTPTANNRCDAPEHKTLTRNLPLQSGGGCQRFFSTFGATWLISSAYIDPGTIQGDLSQGAYTGYYLLWLTFWSTVIGYLFQTCASRIGIATGVDLASHIRLKFPSKELHYTIWLAMELAIIGCDIQAVIGSAFALNILFGFTFWVGCLVTSAGCLFITILYHFRGRLVESITGGCVSILVICYIIQASLSGSPADSVLVGWFYPRSPAYTQLIAIGTVGAIIMPNVIYLQSSLVITRTLDRTKQEKVGEANKFNAIENGIGLGMSFIGNLCVVCVFAAFFTPECASQGLAMIDGNCNTIGLDGVGDTLTSVFGPGSKYVFAIGLYLSGIASVVNSTICSQVIMEGLVEIKMSFGKRMCVTRAVTLIPTLTLCLIYGTNATTLNVLNEWINIAMSFFIPFAAVPVVQIVGNSEIMGRYVAAKWQLVILWSIIAMIMVINSYLIICFVYLPEVVGSVGSFPQTAAFYSFFGAGLLAYGYYCSVLLRSGKTLKWCSSIDISATATTLAMDPSVPVQVSI